MSIIKKAEEVLEHVQEMDGLMTLLRVATEKDHKAVFTEPYIRLYNLREVIANILRSYDLMLGEPGGQDVNKL